MNVEAIYQRLLENPGDTETMLVLSDAIKEQGNEKLGESYRWAAVRKKWPFTRTLFNTGETIYDWDAEGRDVPVPDSARLPRAMYDAIKRMPDKKYGGVNDAFVLLSKVL